MGCGTTTSENTTYFEQTSVSNTGGCSMEVCKCDSNICQIRLDFQTLVISGPSTVTTSVVELLNGDAAAGGLAVADAGRCLTDTFSVGKCLIYLEQCPFGHLFCFLCVKFICYHFCRNLNA